MAIVNRRANRQSAIDNSIGSLQSAVGSRLAFFFVFLFCGRTGARRRTKRFAVIEQRKAGDVERERAAWRLLIDDDRHRTSLDAVAKCETAAAGEARVREPFQHSIRLYYRKARPARLRGAAPHPQRSARISCSNASFDAGPICFVQIVPSRASRYDVGTP